MPMHFHPSQQQSGHRGSNRIWQDNSQSGPDSSHLRRRSGHDLDCSGRPIREYSLESLRHNIGFVPQETFLFSDRIRENIALGVESASNEEIHDAADAANIAVDIESFPEGYRPSSRTWDYALRRLAERSGARLSPAL